MKALVFGGSGKVGSAVAWDLSKDDSIDTIGITGRNLNTLEKTKKWIGSSKIVPHVIDVNDKAALTSLMRQYDAGALALPDRKTSYKVAHAAVENGLNIVDMLEEYHRRPDAYEIEGLEIPEGMTLDQYGDWIHETAIKNNVTFIDGMGFAPGLSNVTLGEGIRKIDKAEKAIARVGGIPSKKAAANHPLRYMITWAFEHVLREYMIKLKVIKNGRVIEVNAATDLEPFVFDKFGKNEKLECAVTPGMPSFIYTRRELKEFAEKTIRWPGHWQGVETLKECGLLDIEPVSFEGAEIAPREFLLSLITPRLKAREGETDVCVMYNTLTGKKGRKNVKIEYFMWDKADTGNNISSMARVTGFPVAIALRLLLNGRISEKGIVPPEDCIKGKIYDWFMKELKKRNIRILEVSNLKKK
ncbi:MAG: saccharopine dehydrogenase NADP-binding domain-containing protein [Candidatus Zixiibacteriota bacterium]|nr:MAG: saccharopine dehydrogenase NADP-binding domain-containing protein [candidate division Zixibacteria bacterium]